MILLYLEFSKIIDLPCCALHCTEQSPKTPDGIALLILHTKCKVFYIFIILSLLYCTKKVRDDMKNQEIFSFEDAWTSSFVQGNLELWANILDTRDILCIPPRMTVFSQGDQAKYVFVIQRGRIILSAPSPSGNEKVLMYAGAGCIIGEQALIAGAEYPYQATTLEDSCFYRIPAQLFLKYLSSNTDVSMAFIFNLLHKNQSLMAHIADLSFKDAEHRLIQELLFCAEIYGKQQGDGVLIQRVFSQENLGKRILASRVTVNKIIRELEQQSLLHREGRRLVLDNVDKLKRMLDIFDR